MFTGIENHLADHPNDMEAWEDYFGLLRCEKDRQKCLKLRENMERIVSESDDVKVLEKAYDLSKRSYLLFAKDYFEDYCIYLEWDREPEKRFYLPRRRTLRVLTQDLQDLADRKLDFLGVSLPPRVGKSTLCIFFITWLMGRNPSKANVMSGHSDKLTSGFYEEALNIINGGEYLWKDVFTVPLVNNSAKNETIDLESKKRFPTFTARSIGGTLTGAVEIGEGGCLYVDDLIEDLEESLNPDRLQSKYDAYLNQLKDRKKDGAFELMVGTRWNVLDPLGRIAEQYVDNPRYRFRVIPALNEEGESNFEYDYGVGFGTQYYVDMKASIDDATWCAKYMGNPYIREGLLFPADELKYYNGVLPDGEGYKVAVCDVAWGGGDSLSMPFAWVYGNDVYIGDVVFNTGDKDVTRPIVIDRLKKHLPHEVEFEANNGGHEYSDKVDEKLREAGVRMNITNRKAPSKQSKLGKILQYTPEIKNFYFLDSTHRTKEYEKFMREVTTFSQTGKNPHDDSVDSLAILARKIYSGGGRVEVIKRPF